MQHHQRRGAAERRPRANGSCRWFPVGFALAFCCACMREPAVVLHPRSGPPVTIAVELALSDAERARGLMWRRDLPEDRGMLFVFPAAEKRAFWMKNTPLSLDIIFLDAQRRVVHIARATVPFSTAPIPSRKPARYVLEVRAGMVDRWGLQPGDSVEFRNVPDHGARPGFAR